MITYLYHKRHRKTGLNYFGKTKRDPYQYKGSGVRWTKHLEKHGNDVETIQVWEFNNLLECSKFAIEFSEKNNIVKSSNWANLCLENGLDGGDKFVYMTDKQIDIINKKRSKKQHIIWETRDRICQANVTSKIWASRSEEENKKIFSKISNTLKNKTLEEKTLTLEKYRKTISERPDIVCPHCGLIGTNIANMKRYHFDRCLKNPSPLPRKPRPTVICEHCNKVTDPGNYKKHHGDRCKFKDENK